MISLDIIIIITMHFILNDCMRIGIYEMTIFTL